MGNEPSQQEVNSIDYNPGVQVPITSEIHQSFNPGKIQSSPNILSPYNPNQSDSSDTEPEDFLSPSFDPFAEFLTRPEIHMSPRVSLRPSISNECDSFKNNDIYIQASQKIYSDNDEVNFLRYPTHKERTSKQPILKKGEVSRTSILMKEVAYKAADHSKGFERKNAIKQTKIAKHVFIRREMHTVAFDEEANYKVLMSKNKTLNDLNLIINLLNTLPFIKDIDKDHSIEIIEDLQYVLFENEAQIMKEGSHGSLVFFIKKGKIKLTTTTQKILVKTLNAPCVLGERIFINDSLRQCDAYAQTPVYAYALPKSKIKIIQQYIIKGIESTVNRSCIDQCPILDLLSVEQKDKLAMHMHKEFYADNRTIINQYDKPNTLFVFLSGTAEKIIYHYKKPPIITQLRPGDIFAYENLIYPKAIHISVISLKQCICLSLVYDSLKDIFETDEFYLSFRNLFIKAELQKDSNFSGIYSQMDNRLLNNFEMKSFCANEVVIPSKTQLSDSLYIVLEGDVYEENEPRVKLKERYGSVLYSEQVYKNKRGESITNVRASSDAFVAMINKETILYHLGKSFDKMSKLLVKKTALQKTKTFSIFQGQVCFLDNLCETIYDTRIKAGEVIYKESDHPDKIFLIRRGKVKTSKNSTDATLGNYSFFGLSAITSLLFRDHVINPNQLDTLKRNEKAIAINDTECIVIERSTFINSFEDNEQMLHYITRRIYYSENKFDLNKMAYYPLYEFIPYTRGLPFLAKISYFEEQVCYCKIYPKMIYEDEQQISDIATLLPVIQSIDTPFIPKLINYLITDNFIAYLYHYVPGNKLGNYMDDLPACSYDLIKVWGMQLLIAIRALHNKKIMHRTINVDNVMIDSNGNIALKQLNKVAMFPIANTHIPVTSDIHFLAPEMLYGHNDYKLSVDYWAFGVLLYLLICKQYPFGKNETDQKKILSSIINDDFYFPNNVTNEIFKDLIFRLLNKAEEKRLKTFEEIKEHSFFSCINPNQVEKFKSRILLNHIMKPSFNAYVNEKYFCMDEIQEMLIERMNRKTRPAKKKLSRYKDMSNNNYA